MADDGQVLEAYERHLGPRYAHFLEERGLAATVEEATGSTIRDSEGRAFIDFVAGYGLFNFGHNPPRIVEALRDELSASPLWNRPFLNERFAEVTEKLVSLTPDGLDRVLLTNTGAEAVESAVKLARLSTRKSRIVAAEGGFHGFTLGALSVSGIPSQTRPFRPLLPGVDHVPFGDASAMDEALDEDTAAVVLEPIQAEVGAIEPPDGYLAEVRELCDRYGALLVIDEIRTGMGRTGRLFAIEGEEVVPDILLLGKALAGGIVPVGALVASSEHWTKVGYSFAMTASSFSGNRLSCTATLATLDFLEEAAPLAQGAKNSAILEKAVTRIAGDVPGSVDGITGKGLLLGLHFETPDAARKTVSRCVGSGLLTATAFCNSRCILLEPPLVMEEETTSRGAEILAEACIGDGA